MTPLLWTVRFAAALGLTSLTLTGEITPSYWGACWFAWLGSFWLDRYPDLQQRFRSWETAEVMMLISVFLADFFFWNYSIFVSMAHFLLLFQFFKLIGAKTLKDCLQIFIFSFFQILSACTLSVDAWHGMILLLLIPTATAALFWLQVGRDMAATGESLPANALKPYRRWLGGMCLAALPLNLLLAVAMFMVFPRLAFRAALAGRGSGRSGYNDQVNLAQTGVLQTDNNAVLWLKLVHPQDRS